MTIGFLGGGVVNVLFVVIKSGGLIVGFGSIEVKED